MAMDERRVDEKLLISAFIGRLCCALAKALLRFWEQKLQVPLDLLMREHFDKTVFNIRTDLDVPTYDDKIVQGRLEATSRDSYGSRGVAWESLSVVLGLFSSFTRLVTELCVLAKVVGSQQDGISFAVVHLSQELSKFLLAPDWTLSGTTGQSFELSEFLSCGSDCIDISIQRGSRSPITSIMSNSMG